MAGAGIAPQCGICFEEGLDDVGELDCCEHTFCFACISRWMEEESRCPFCKKLVKLLTRKRLSSAAPALDRAAGSSHGGRPTKRRKWIVLERLQVPEKRQVVETDPEDLETLQYQQHLETMVCEMCHSADDEDLILLCDGCDNGFHTYCVGLASIPDGEFYCRSCHSRRAAHETSRESASDSEKLFETESETSETSTSDEEVEFVRVSVRPRLRPPLRQTSRQAQGSGGRMALTARQRARPERRAATTSRPPTRRSVAADSSGWRTRRPLGRVARHRMGVDALRASWEDVRQRGFAEVTTNGIGSRDENNRSWFEVDVDATQRSGRSATDWLVENKSDPVVGLSWTNFDSLRGRSSVAREDATPERIAVPRPPPRNGIGTVHRARVARVTPAALTVDRWPISRPSSPYPPSTIPTHRNRKRSRADFESTCGDETVNADGRDDRRDSRRAGQPNSPKEGAGNATSGSTSDRRSSRSSALCAWRRDLKRDACAIAKDILRGLLHQGRIDRAQFKDAAQCATHRLYERNKYRRVNLTTAMVEAEIERFLWG